MLDSLQEEGITSCRVWYLNPNESTQIHAECRTRNRTSRQHAFTVLLHRLQVSSQRTIQSTHSMRQQYQCLPLALRRS